MNDMGKKRLPVGIENFEEIRTDGIITWIKQR